MELYLNGFDFDKCENYEHIYLKDFALYEKKHSEQMLKSDPESKHKFKSGLDFGCFILEEDSNINQNEIISSRVVPDIKIPRHIKYLRLDLDASKYKYFQIPEHIEYIELPIDFKDIDINDVLEEIIFSPNLKSIKFNFNFNIDYLNDLNNLEIDKIQKHNDILIKIYDKLREQSLINNLEYLAINIPPPNYINEFKNLKTLILNFDTNNRDYEDFNEPLDNLPPTLEWLEINSTSFYQPLKNLPPNLKVLLFGQCYIIQYKDGYQHSLEFLPSSLEVLWFPENIPMSPYDSKYLNTLYLADLQHLPPKLKILYIPQCINENMNFDNMPDSIEILVWDEFRTYYKNNKITRFPANLKKIKIYNRWYLKEELIGN